MKLKEEREKVIDLTDSSRNNSTPVVRELDLEVNPITGTHTYFASEANRSSKRRNPTDPNDMIDDSSSAAAVFITTAGEDKGQSHPEPYQPPEIEPQDEERLEAEGATILDSTTYYHASKMSVSKRSMTPEESMAERQEQYYFDR